MIKQHSKNEFYSKKVRGGYYVVIDGYDMSMASLENSKKEAEAMCRKLNEMRNNRF